MAMLQIGSLWRGKDGGRASATGTVNLPDGVALSVSNLNRLVLLPNDKKGNDRAPDWRLMLADDEQNESPPPNGGRL